MLRVTTDGAVPGRYAGTLCASTDTDGKVAMELAVEVVDVILPELDSWKAPGKEFLVCLICVCTTMDKDIKKCPVCAAPRGKFEVFK